MKATYIDHMGTDLSVVNAARVSFAKVSEWEWVEEGGDGWMRQALSEADSKLIHYLAKHKHWTPFAHTAITVHVKAPLFVARQLGKHQVGMVWNEVSRRYVSDTPELYTPDTFRNAPVGSVKQGSSGKHYDSDDWVDIYVNCSKDLLNLYHQMIKDGVAPEQARMVLPQSMYTEWYWTGNLVSFVNMWKLRTDSHTQRETQQVAHQIGEIIKPLFPVSWQALTQWG